MTQPSPLKRREIIDALRMGAVPRRGLELFATGLDAFVRAIDEELDAVAAGQGKFKAVRGEYGTGKTFFARWLEHRARGRGFATTLVQISETETPIYRLETVYRRAIEGLETAEWSTGAFRSLVDRWFYDLEDEVLAGGSVAADDTSAVTRAVGALLESRLAEVSKVQPQFAAALRACHRARLAGDVATAEGLVAWLMGQPSVAASIKRTAGIKGDLDNDAAAGFLRGLLELLRQTGRKGLVLVLDELETIQRVRTDSREKSLNALRTLIDAVADNQYPGLYVLITGTPHFFDGPQGVRRLEPLAMRLHTQFDDSGFDNPRAVQLRLRPFTIERMVEVGRKVRDLYPSEAAARIAGRVPDAVLDGLAHGVAGQLGGRVGVAPRIYLKRLVDVLDRVDQHEGFDPAKHYELVLRAGELTAEERAAAGMERSVDDIELELGAGGAE
jgi:P-loop Domain of unknown function (DUF2791)